MREIAMQIIQHQYLTQNLNEEGRETYEDRKNDLEVRKARELPPTHKKQKQSIKGEKRDKIERIHQ